MAAVLCLCMAGQGLPAMASQQEPQAEAQSQDAEVTEDASGTDPEEAEALAEPDNGPAYDQAGEKKDAAGIAPASEAGDDRGDTLRTEEWEYEIDSNDPNRVILFR